MNWWAWLVAVPFCSIGLREYMAVSKELATKKKMNIDDNLKDSLIVSFFTAFTIGVFTPLEFFASNAASVWFDLEDILLVSGIVFIALFGLVFVACYICSLVAKKVPKAMCIIFSALTIMLYIQGNFLQINYGYLGAETIDFSQFELDGITNSSIWAGMALILLLILVKKKQSGYMRFIRVVAVCILLVQVSTLIAVSPMVSKYQHKENYVATTKGMNNYSKEKNMVIIIPDSFDSRVMYDLLQSEEGEEYANMLEDFTYYRDTLSCFSLTDFSVPQMLTGEKYLNQCEYGDYLNDAFEKSPLLNRLEDEQWDIGIGTTITLPQGEIAGKVSNWAKVDYSINNMWLFIRGYYRTLAFRYFPHVLKEMVYFDIDDMEDYREIKTINGEEPGEDSQYDWTNLAFKDSIDKMTAESDANTFKVIHTKGLHSHRNVDLEFNKLKDEEEVSLENTAKVVLKLLNIYTDKLRELGIYDNTIIIVAADHGSYKYTDGWQYQNSVLMIKGINENHNLKLSEAQITYDDLIDCYKNLLDDKTDNEIIGIDENVVRERYTYRNFYEGDLKSFSKGDEFEEYVTTSPAYLCDETRKTGKKY